jgi:hypothetical protein
MLEYIKKLFKGDTVDIMNIPKLYDLSDAKKILVMAFVDVGNLPKQKSEEYLQNFAVMLTKDGGAFSNKDLYTVLVIPNRTAKNTIELYSVPA